MMDFFSKLLFLPVLAGENGQAVEYGQPMFVIG